MKIKVIKVGGLLLSKDNHWNAIIEYLKTIKNQYRIVLVCSAIGRENDPYSTDGLNNSVKGYLTMIERNQLKALGETYSTLKVTGDLRQNGFKVKLLTWDRLGLLISGTDFNFDPKPLSSEIKDNEVVVVPGFIGCDENGYVTTFKREGSDYSAVIFAYYLDCNECYLVKDINGVYDASHNVYHELTYDQFLEITENFTSPIAKEAISFCKKRKMKLFVINSSGCVVCKLSKKLNF